MIRILTIFLWILFGAIVLWFFSLNLDQEVTVQIFTFSYENVNLVAIIFIALFVGVIIGALLLTAQVLKAKTQLAAVKKDNKKLLSELDTLRSLSVKEVPGPDQENSSSDPNY